jgi:hypothetical protein
MHATALTMAACLAGITAYAGAQTKAAPAVADQTCPMHQAAELSDVKVEQTKDGAIIRLVAKRPEDIGKVQDSAQRMATMLSHDDCPMHAGHGMHGHHPSSSPAH